jgi:hypothetical protein
MSCWDRRYRPERCTCGMLASVESFKCWELIPGKERREDTECTAGPDAACLWCAAVVDEVSDAEHQEGQVKGEEQQEESDGRSECADDQEEGEDEPSLRSRSACGVFKMYRVGTSLHTMRYRPKELRNGYGLSASRVAMISKPPGVRIIAVPIQKPP